MEKRQKWLVIEGQDDWQIIIPDFDSKPHADMTKKPKRSGKREVAWLNCPCNPEIDYLSKRIIHNSFIDKARIDESMVVNLYENPAEFDY